MRCLACDCALSSSESVRKGKHSGEYLDLCNKCFLTIEEDVEVTDPYFLEENYEDPEAE